jgi:hypothetical protein
MSITSQEKKTYFLLLGADVPPEAVRLGHIIVDPTRPERALNTPLTPIPAHLPIYKTDLREYSRTFDTTQFSGAGLLARFLHFFSLGIEGSGGISHGTQELQSYSVQDMHTEWFSPTPAFVEQSMLVPRIFDFLDATDFEKPLYLVTGVKTAKGACVTMVHSNNSGPNTKVAGPGHALEASYTSNNKTSKTTKFASASPLVFAYQICEIKYKRTGGWDVEDYEKGAMLGKNTEVEAVRVSVTSLTQPGQREMAVKNLAAMDVIDEATGETCVCVAPAGRI